MFGLDGIVHVAMIAAAIFLLTNKDLELSDVDDPRRSWRMNAVLAFICAVYVWRGDSAPVYRPQSSAGTIVAWMIAAIWIGHAIFQLRLFRPATADQPQLVRSSMGLTSTALIALLEELIFRGWFQNIALVFAYAISGQVYGIFVVNLLFALAHYNRGFMFAMSAGFVGTIFSIATLASGSLLPAIVMHVGWNVLMGIARTRPHAVVETAG